MSCINLNNTFLHTSPNSTPIQLWNLLLHQEKSYILLYAFIKVRYNQKEWKGAYTILLTISNACSEFTASNSYRFVSLALSTMIYNYLNRPREHTLKFWGIFLDCFALTMAPMKIEEVFGLPGSYMVF
jgi:hypothetical protein